MVDLVYLLLHLYEPPPIVCTGALIQPILAYGYTGNHFSIFNGVYDWNDQVSLLLYLSYLRPSIPSVVCLLS